VNHRAGYSRVSVVVCSLLALVSGGLIGYFTPRSQASAPLLISTPFATSTPAPTPTAAPVRVYVSGAVSQPDVYELPPGCIVRDALEAAGGAADDADLDSINLALEVTDQQQVYVPRRGEAAQPPQSASSGVDSSARAPSLVNINTASLAELDTLPRVGPVTAQRIIDYRAAHGPFQRIEDIQNVSGIGPATFEGMRDLISVGQ
jgi:competence protein ComEA